MHRGYIKLHRKLLDAGLIKNHKLCALWIWCLLKASHKEFDAIVGLQTVHLLPGQFIFGRKKASEETRLKEHEVRTRLSFLEKAGNITIKPTTKFSIITIVNWHIYQRGDNEINQQNNPPVTNKEPAANHIQEHKNEKNEKKNDFRESFICPDWLPKEQWNDYVEMRVKIRKPLTDKAKTLAVGKLKKLAEEGHDPGEVLNQSTIGSYQGLFELKGGSNYGGAGKAAQRIGRAKSDGQPYPVDYE